MMYCGWVPPSPNGLMLLEDAVDLWSWANAMGRTYPPQKWVDEWISEAAEQSLKGLC